MIHKFDILLKQLKILNTNIEQLGNILESNTHITTEQLNIWANTSAKLVTAFRELSVNIYDSIVLNNLNKGNSFISVDGNCIDRYLKSKNYL